MTEKPTPTPEPEPAPELEVEEAPGPEGVSPEELYAEAGELPKVPEEPE
jgi:hypothetical protein